MTDRYQDLGDTPPPVVPEAWAKVDDLIRAGGDGWKELADLYRRPAGKRSRSNPATAAHPHLTALPCGTNDRKDRQKRQKRASR